MAGLAVAEWLGENGASLLFEWKKLFSRHTVDEIRRSPPSDV